MCADKLNIPITYRDLDASLYPSWDKNLAQNNDFRTVLDLVNRIARDRFPESVFTQPYKVLYFRNDVSRRKMVGYDGQLDKYFDKIVYDFNSMPIDEQIKLFMKCSHFVTIEGAATTNIIFMNKSAKMLTITNHPNSWPLMFGTASCIQSVHSFSLNKRDFDADIQYSNSIEKEIIRFITT